MEEMSRKHESPGRNMDNVGKRYVDLLVGAVQQVMNRHGILRIAVL